MIQRNKNRSSTSQELHPCTTFSMSSCEWLKPGYYTFMDALEDQVRGTSCRERKAQEERDIENAS